MINQNRLHKFDNKEKVQVDHARTSLLTSILRT